ncbi:hypothetical protein [Chromobacterium violaceum]|uniref:hypothetical protein n=1 Tax=Chromobacterium violaceum TaxID=536 RepID=UPI00111C9183|nr:hypothetical protein [Chromobacterium violaceum]
MVRRLSGLLRNLIHNPGFSQSEQELEMPRGVTRVRDFFVPFDQAREDRLGQYRGFWGMVSDANDGRGAVWINSGGRGDVSVCLPYELQNEFFRRFRVEDNEALSGAYVLVIGELAQSVGGKIFIRVDDLALITAILA